MTIEQEIEHERDALLSELQEYATELRISLDMQRAEILADAKNRLVTAPQPTTPKQRAARARWRRFLEESIEVARVGKRPDFARLRWLNAEYYRERK